IYEYDRSTAGGAPAPVHRCRGPQGRGPDPWRGEPEAHAARVRAGWRLLGAAVRLRVRRADPGRRHLRGEPGREAAGRSDERAVPHRRRDRLPRGARGRAVRDPQPAGDHHLWLRLVLRRRLSPAPSACLPLSPPDPLTPDPTPALPLARFPTFSRRWTWGATVSTWWSRATRTASWSSSIACARWCASPLAWPRTAASTRT